MPDIPGIPEEFVSVSGVQMTPPPAELLPSITAAVNNAASSLQEGERGRLVWIAQKVGSQKSVNAVMVNKVNDHVQLVHWFGKTWGTPISAGLAAGTGGVVSW